MGSQRIPTYLMEENPELRGDEFDFMSVFTILDHIKVVDEYQLAYVNQYDMMAWGISDRVRLSGRYTTLCEL